MARKSSPPATDDLLSSVSAWRTQYSQLKEEYDELLRRHHESEREFEEKQKQALAELQAARERAFDELRVKCHAERLEREQKLLQVAPIGSGDVDALPTVRAAYSDRTAAMMAKLSMLTYFAFEDEEKKAILNEILKHGNITLLHTIAVDETEAMVAESEKFVAVAFRGTTSRNDVRTDLQARFNVAKVYVDGFPDEVVVHSGFHAAFMKVKDELERLLQETGNKPIYFTGHSLGGALALLASAVLAGQDKVTGRSGADKIAPRMAAVYTFGAPRVGNEGFGRFVKAPHYRVVNRWDLVPLVPPTWLLNYRHTGMPILLYSGALEPVRRSPWGLASFYGLLSVLMWPFTRSLASAKAHDSALYVERLELIARYRGSLT